MTRLPDPSLALRRQQHLHAGAAAIAILALTSIHHAYGAYAFETPWRLHILAIVVPAAIGIVVALSCGAAMSGRPQGRRSTLLAALLILLFPVGAIGFYEGGYNHVLKNLVYVVGGEARARALFPPPLYEMPRDVFFEATGIAQFPLSIAAAVLALRLLRGPAGAAAWRVRGQARGWPRSGEVRFPPCSDAQVRGTSHSRIGDRAARRSRP